MEISTVIAKFIEIHREYQRDGGYSDVDKISSETCPLSGLEGFDSDFIPEIVRRVARELGNPLPERARVKNIYVSADGRRKLSIDGIARLFAAAYLPKGITV